MGTQCKKSPRMTNGTRTSRNEGDIENEKLDPVVEAWEGVLVIGYCTVPSLFFSVVSFWGGLTMLGAILLLFAILGGGIGFLIGQSNGNFDYFKKTKPKPATAKPNPTPAKPQAAQKSPVEEDPDSEGRLVLVFIGLVMLLMFVIFIQII